MPYSAARALPFSVGTFCEEREKDNKDKDGVQTLIL
jgi:hypothetical protein